MIDIDMPCHCLCQLEWNRGNTYLIENFIRNYSKAGLPPLVLIKYLSMIGSFM